MFQRNYAPRRKTHPYRKTDNDIGIVIEVYPSFYKKEISRHAEERTPVAKRIALALALLRSDVVHVTLPCTHVPIRAALMYTVVPLAPEILRGYVTSGCQSRAAAHRRLAGPRGKAQRRASMGVGEMLLLTAVLLLLEVLLGDAAHADVGIVLLLIVVNSAHKRATH